MSTKDFRQVPLTCPGHTRPVVHIHFTDVDEDGKSKFISASKDGKPMLHNGSTGDWIGTFDGHKGAVWGCCLNKYGTRAATGAADFTAKLWDANKGVELVSLPHKHVVKSVDFSHDSKRLLTGCNDKLIRLYDMEDTNTNTTPVSTLEGHSDSIKCAVWTGDPNLFVSSEETSSIRLWDVRTSATIREIEMGGAVFDIELSKDCAILTITHTTGVTFMDSKTLEIIKTHQLQPDCKVYSSSLHVSKNFFVTGGEDFKLYKYNFQTGEELESYKGHFGPVHCVRYSPDGHLYCSGSEDGTVRLWQHNVGETYGLWKNPLENGNGTSEIVELEHSEISLLL